MGAQVAPYFAKVECFCFEEQKLMAGEEVDMPLLFFIDKDILDDPNCRKIDDIVLSYTFFKWVHSIIKVLHTTDKLCRARRTASGMLEPDASEDVVQKSMGFDGYELAPKKEDREDTGAGTSKST
jgi:cytochrome c oxidase assembly protein subunit 11